MSNQPSEFSPETKKAMFDRAVAVLTALNAEFFISVSGIEPVQRYADLPAGAPAKGKAYVRPNVNRNKNWGYHAGVKLMRLGVPVTFVYPAGADRKEFDKLCIAYAKLTHNLKKDDLLVEHAGNALKLTILA